MALMVDPEAVLPRLSQSVSATEVRFASGGQSPGDGSPARRQESNLVAMIRRSGMSTNYVSRCSLNTNGTGRLDYHDLERGCHFQIDLAKTNDTWAVKRIWFCR